MSQKSKISIVALIAVLVAAYFGVDLKQDLKQSNEHALNPTDASTQYNDANQRELSSADNDDAAKIATLFQKKMSDVQVRASGEVVAILNDDNEGSRHQKFILKLNHGQTVLVAHNIDLAPRVENIQKGDIVEFYGEYEYTDKGGVIHWTHHDPQKLHIDGWLKHQGRSYQ